MGAGKFGIGDASTPTITFDTVNDRLGVGSGITNPAYLIDAYSTNATTNIISIGGTTNYSLFQSFNNSGVFDLAIDNSAGSGFSQGAYSRVLHSTGAYPLVISTNSTERMRILSGGNVGIGTTTPDIFSRGYDRILGLNSSTGVAKIELNGSSSSGIDFGQAGSRVAEINGFTTGLEIGTVGSTPIYFTPNGTTRVAIASGGDVGIGTTTPAYKLDVNGRTLVNQFEYTRAIDISGGDLNSYTLAGFYNGSSMTNAPNSGWFWVTVEVFSGDTGWIHQTATSFGSGNTANEVYTRVKSSSTWGVWKKLVDSGDVSGTTNYIPKFTGTSTLGNSVIYDNSGLIGIGTTSPGAKLHIAAAALGTSTGDSVLNSIHYNSNGNSEELEIKSVRTSAGSDWTTAGKRIQMRIDSTYMGYMQFNGTGNQAGISFGTGTTTSAPGNVTERMRIDSSGNVGIGTASPSSKLHLNGTTTLLTITDTTYNRTSEIGYLDSANLYLANDNASNTYIGRYNNVFLAYGGGNVGIGTTSPTQLLDVTSTSSNAVLNLDGLSTATTGLLFRGSGVERGRIVFANSNDMRFTVGISASEYMRITSTGNVGIGTASPGSKLDVAGALGGTVGVGGSTLRLINTDTANYASITAGVIGVTNSGMQFSTDGTTRMIIASSGNVSIGTTSAPGNRLIVSQDTTYNNENTYTIAAAASTNIAYKTVIGYDYSNDIGVISSVAAGIAWKNLSLVPNGGNVGIGTLTPGYKLDVNGNTNVNGTLTATVKSFIIDHPTKENKKLQYGVLEGPEHSVYVRGKLTNTNVIQLPDYWHALVHEDSITVNLTAIGKPQEIWVEEITDTYITVGSTNLNVSCFYTVFAERKDVDKLVTEFDKE